MNLLRHGIPVPVRQSRLMRTLDLPDVFRLREALARGWTRHEVDCAVDSGDIVWLRHGWYAVPRPHPLVESWEKYQLEHLESLRLALLRFPGHAASHTSAALMHDLAVSIAPATPVDLTAIDRAACSRREPGLVLHHSDSMTNAVDEVKGVMVTTMDRTIADFLRMRRLPHGLALLDDALRRDLTDVGRVRRVLDQQKRWRGRPRALGALSLADPVRESWAESYSFGQLHMLGVPMPLHQVDILDENLRWLARVDGLWPEAGVVGECDGLDKYFISRQQDERAPEEVVRDNLAAEKSRQGPMEELGLRFVRWTPSEMREDSWAVAVRVNAAFATAQPQAFRGYVVWQGEARRLPFPVQTPHLDPESLRYRRPRRRR